MLIPAFQLYGLRAQGEAAPGALTLLLGGSHLEGLDPSHLAALVTDSALGGKVADQIAQLQRPVLAVDQATTIRSLLEQLLSCSTPLAGASGTAVHWLPCSPCSGPGRVSRFLLRSLACVSGQRMASDPRRFITSSGRLRMRIICGSGLLSPASCWCEVCPSRVWRTSAASPTSVT